MPIKATTKAIIMLGLNISHTGTSSISGSVFIASHKRINPTIVIKIKNDFGIMSSRHIPIRSKGICITSILTNGVIVFYV